VFKESVKNAEQGYQLYYWGLAIAGWLLKGAGKKGRFIRLNVRISQLRIKKTAFVKRATREGPVRGSGGVN